MNIPDKETIEYGRRIILGQIEWCQKVAESAKENGRNGEKWKGAEFVLNRMLGGGCSIGSFDERWLDDKFREMMGKIDD